MSNANWGAGTGTFHINLRIIYNPTKNLIIYSHNRNRRANKPSRAVSVYPKQNLFYHNTFTAKPIKYYARLSIGIGSAI